jgi:hypothetical protein
MARVRVAPLALRSPLRAPLVVIVPPGRTFQPTGARVPFSNEPLAITFWAKASLNTELTQKPIIVSTRQISRMLERRFDCLSDGLFML